MEANYSAIPSFCIISNPASARCSAAVIASRSLVPGEFLGACAELVAAFGRKACAHHAMRTLSHSFKWVAEHHALCVIVAECHGVVALGTFIGDFAY